jgi:hypothetical protein
MTHSPPSYFCSIPATDIWYPVAPGTTTLPEAPTPTVNASPVPVNAAELPEDWDPDEPDLCYLFQDILATSAPAVYPLVVTPGAILPPYLEAVSVLAVTRTRLVVMTIPYAPTLPTAEVALVTRTTVALPPVPTRVSGTLAPVLGATRANSTTATAAGWSLLFDGTSDEDNTLSETLVNPIYINSTSFTECYVNSNSYLTFGGSILVYSSLSATIPAITKIHLGAGDWSYQRVYQLNDAASSRIRWEGNSNYDALAGDSNRFLDVAFFTTEDGTQFVEIRTGSIGGSTAVPFMIATASTALATATFTANESWVFEGNAAGTTWTAHEGEHIELV